MGGECSSAHCRSGPPSPTFMSLEAARNLSIHDLLRVLAEKLGLECTRVQQIPLLPVGSAASLASEVSVPWQISVLWLQNLTTNIQIKNLETGARDVLRFIPSLRNMLQPVNRLPPEIIADIARYRSVDARWVVPLTHVCRYWRESIISAPENWTSISCYRRSLARLSLERSKASPLRLWLAMDQIRQHPEFCDLLTPYIQKTETLEFHHLTTARDFTRTLPNFPQSMPNLRSLELVSAEVPRWNPSTDPFGPLPRTLRSLSLKDIPLYPSFLKLKTLTKFSLQYLNIIPSPLDTVLDLLEGNCSLENVDLKVYSKEFPVGTSQHRAVITNRLQHLSITCSDAMAIRTIVSAIPLGRGARLEIDFRGNNTGLGLNDILSDIPVAHLSNLLSPTYMEYHSNPRVIQLVGPNGSLSYRGGWPPVLVIPFAEFPVLPLTNIQELHLSHTKSSTVFHPSSFPALKTLVVIRHTETFSSLLSNPSSFPSLKTIGFVKCDITEQFMEELIRFASDRKNTTLAWLHSVLIVHRWENFPAAATISRLEGHVPVVDTWRFPKVLT